ncbi:ATP-grasp domain-containing protein [Streptomyces sp. NBC_01240]|uniref:ATP-grasp domain-containing protein n=1 Tax=Streptomyces sp. NBC_01240 TaxID=2903793 RepID=UPI002E0E496D|nr:ATP-grasp domain-containing protein [Streptomyces sp. NBC_01240]
MTDRVLLIGGKPDGSVEALAAHGARITCVARPKHARSLRRHGTVEQVVAVGDPADVEEVLLGLAREGIRLDEFDVVTSGLENGLVAAAALGACTGARALPLETAVLVRDKHAQKTALRKAGIPVARSAAFDEPDELAAAVAEVGGVPVVVKPPDGAGARDTRVLRSPTGLSTWTASHSSGPWLCEEFVPGTELHLDGVVRNGELTQLCISRYFANTIQVQDGALNGSVTLREADHAACYATARPLLGRLIPALGLTSGVFHLEAFEQPNGELVFSECGGRVAGARIDRTVLLATGVDLHREWAAAALDAPSPERAEPADDHLCYGWLNLLAPEGRILSLPSLDEIRAQPGVVDAELKLAPGADMTSFQDANTRAGRAILSGSTPADVLATATALNSWFRSTARTTP